MNTNQLQKALQNYKKGTYIKVKMSSITKIGNDTYEKITETVVRFVSYKSVKKTLEKETNTKTSNNQVIIQDICYYNPNTNNYLVHMYVSKNPKHKAKTTYTCNGVEIEKETYETNIKPRKHSIDLMFVKKLQDIISIG